MSGSSASRPVHPETAKSQVVPSSSRLLPVCAVAAAILWYSFLIGLVVVDERPVVVNRVQLRESQLVVSGTVAADGTVTVLEVFKGPAPNGELQLVEPFSFPAGDWILPLVPLGARFEVAPTRLPNRARLVYPVSDDVTAQVEALLARD